MKEKKKFSVDYPLFFLKILTLKKNFQSKKNYDDRKNLHY